MLDWRDKIWYSMVDSLSCNLGTAVLTILEGIDSPSMGSSEDSGSDYKPAFIFESIKGVLIRSKLTYTASGTPSPVQIAMSGTNSTHGSFFRNTLDYGLNTGMVWHDFWSF